MPTLPWAMGVTFMTGVVVGLPGVEVVAGWCAAMLLKYHIAVVGWFGRMRQFLVEIPKYQWWVFGVYGVLVLLFVIRLIGQKVVKLREVR